MGLIQSTWKSNHHVPEDHHSTGRIGTVPDVPRKHLATGENLSPLPDRLDQPSGLTTGPQTGGCAAEIFVGLIMTVSVEYLVT